MSWQRRRLKDVTSLVNGFPFDAKSFSDSGFPLVRIRDLFADEFETFVPEADVPKDSIIKAGDLVIGMDGDFNSVLWNRGPAALNQRLCLLRGTPEVDIRFIAYAISEHLKVINDLTYATTVKHLSSKQVANIVLNIPPLAEQRAIADYLDRETAQIDFLLDRISTLKVQVEERLGVLISEVLRGSLEPNSAMVETSDEALGLIPAGWEAKRLKFLGNSIIGLTYAPEDLCDPGEDSTPVIRAGNIQSGRLVDTDTVHVSKAIPENLRLRIDDIVICARNGSAKLIGKNAIVGPNWESATWGAFMVVFRSDLNNFLHWVFKSEIFKSRLGSFSTSTINQLTSAQLNNLLVPVPPIRERDRICAYLSGVSKETEKLLDRLVLLHRFAQERRAALITAAVTGQIDVSQGRAA